MSEVKQEAIDPTKFGYRVDAKIELTGQEFMILQHMAQKAIGNGVEEKFIQTYEWVLLSTGEVVEKPTQKQVTDGLVSRVPSKQKTLMNKQISYNTNLHPEVFDGNEVIFKAHMRNISSQVATPVDVLQAEFSERQAAEAAKGQMTIVPEEGEQQKEELVVADEPTNGAAE